VSILEAQQLDSERIEREIYVVIGHLSEMIACERKDEPLAETYRCSEQREQALLRLKEAALWMGNDASELELN